ncbi:LsmAD domain-containing protein [Mycena sanguinolenta]|uniref:LsmAD domain-containing protein n=1 Tax=Mycena sanguinolenta TaxID=230812 RepID=A0A8H6ZEN4_9AGAR|nr:LsmAD domain-containing protein [Mycena sanguinolenta]
MASAARQPKPARKGPRERARFVFLFYSPKYRVNGPETVAGPTRLVAPASFPRPNGTNGTSAQDKVLRLLAGLTVCRNPRLPRSDTRGVLASTNGQGDTPGVTLKDVKEITNPGGPLKGQLFIAATNIDTWASGPADAKVPNGDSFRTDADISQKKPAHHERELRAWQPSPDGGPGPQPSSGADDETFGAGSKGQLDQFNADEKLFGVKTTFDEDAHTTKLDRNAPDFKERERKAQRIANEIIRAGTNNPHIAEERNQNVDDSGANEQDKYDAVVRGKDAYVPPGARKTGGDTAPAGNVAKTDIPKLAVNGPDGTSVPSQTPSKSPSPAPSGSEPNDPFPPFSDFITNEKQRLQQKRQALVKSDMDKRMADFVKFSQRFKARPTALLNKPIPDDLVPILAKDEEKQRAIKEKSIIDATSAQARNVDASSSTVPGVPRRGPLLAAQISQGFNHKPSAGPVDKAARAPPATKGTTAEHAAPASALHRGPWLEIHRNLVSYVSHTLELYDGSSDEIVQLSKQWAQWNDLTSIANYRFVVQTLFDHLMSSPNSNRASALNIWNQISADLLCVLRQMSSILSNPTSYKLFLGCRGAVAQQLLDLLQDLLDLPDLRVKAPLSKAVFSKVLLRLSGACGLHPTCFTIDGLEKMGRQVAGGGFGDIWKGSVGGQIVAVKSMRQFADDDVKASLKKLGREALIWRQLSHPNLLPFFGLYILEHRLSLISPWMEKGDLRLFLSTAPPDMDRVSLIADVAMGVEYLHNEHIVHGDLKSPNILVTPSGRACITDFGLSTIVDELSLKMTFSSRSGQAGTVRYQAPELLKNESSNHYGSDVYAFACVSYEISTGKVPFFELTKEVAIMFKVVEGARPTRLSVISQDLWLLLEDCWHQQTDKRPAMAAGLQRILGQHIGNDIKQSPPDWDDAYSARFRRSVQEWPVLPSVAEMERRLLSKRPLNVSI